MDFRHSDRALDWQDRLRRFMDERVLPRSAEYWAQVREDHSRQPPAMEAMKAQAREAGLWNMFLPGDHGAGLTNLEYAPLAEQMGRALWSAEVFNCNAPDTGNMEVLHMYGNAEQQTRWLKPLMAGEIRSAFLMTEPEVASSDATVSMSWDDFMALSNGQLDPMMAFMQGKLKIAGDMMIAQKLAPLLKR